MKALCLTEPFKVEVLVREMPRIKEGEALVKVESVAICGSDIHAYHGLQAMYAYPRVIGHELCGTIAEIKSKDSNLNIGDKVVVIPYVHCGQCISCRKGKIGSCEHLKVTGVHVDGGACEYLAVTEQCLIKIPAETDSVRASLIEPMAISAHGVHNAKVKAGENVLVLGIGPIGLGAAEIAKTYGANVILADTSENRRKFAAERFHYEHILNPLDSDYKEQLIKITNGDMPDTIIDTTGNDKSMSATFEYLSYGGKIVFIGITKGNITFNDVIFHSRQTELYGSRAATRFDFEYVITCMNEGKIDPKKFLTDEIDFDENIVDSFNKLMDKGPAMFKGVIHISK